jgi:flavin-dependent dehydrogenase
VTRLRDVVVVGGGPAGLALAIAAATRGLDVTVLERGVAPLDKACGEGLLPAGRRALEALGVVPLLPAAEVAVLRRIHWVEADGIAARLALPPPGGLGIRRTALRAALAERAAALDVEVIEGAEVIRHARAPGRVRAEVAGGGAVEARVLVAADGLASPVRRREGLERPVGGARRFGVRRHFAVAPWADAVEVHFGEGAEAYVTPVGAGRVGVALLFERGPQLRGAGFEALLARFPAVVARLGGAPPVSEVRGAGPFARASRARVADRLVLLGDAAGYLDAVTGEGLSLAFGCALDLAALLPEALARGASAEALAGYERAWRRRFLPYAAWTRLVLGLSRHPGLRRRVLALAAARPRPFERMVAAAVG